MSDTTERGVSVGNGELRIDGRVERLYGGAVHYGRLDREKWDGILQSVKDLGFTNDLHLHSWLFTIHGVVGV